MLHRVLSSFLDSVVRFVLVFYTLNEALYAVCNAWWGNEDSLQTPAET
jgi:hypothetical protein